MKYARKMKRERAESVVIGIDPSLVGTGLAVLINGWPRLLAGWTNKKTLQKKNDDKLSWFDTPKKFDHAGRMFRISSVADWVLGHVIAVHDKHPQAHVAMEGYAFSRSSHAASDIHELCGVIKRELWVMEIPLRIYDPLSIKMVATGAGNADKEEMKAVCSKRYAISLEPLGDAAENVADAVHTGALLHTELEVRAGRKDLTTLDDKTRAVLLRTTKAEPEAPITRPFIHKDGTPLPAPIVGGVLR